MNNMELSTSRPCNDSQRYHLVPSSWRGRRWQCHPATASMESRHRQSGVGGTPCARLPARDDRRAQLAAVVVGANRCRVASRLATEALVTPRVATTTARRLAAIPGRVHSPRLPPGVKGAARRQADGLRPPLTPVRQAKHWAPIRGWPQTGRQPASALAYKIRGSLGRRATPTVDHQRPLTTIDDQACDSSRA